MIDKKDTMDGLTKDEHIFLGRMFGIKESEINKFVFDIFNDDNDDEEWKKAVENYIDENDAVLIKPFLEDKRKLSAKFEMQGTTIIVTFNKKFIFPENYKADFFFMRLMVTQFNKGLKKSNKLKIISPNIISCENIPGEIDLDLFNELVKEIEEDLIWAAKRYLKNTSKRS